MDETSSVARKLKKKTAQWQIPPDEGRKELDKLSARVETLTVEQRSFGVDGEIRNEFKRLWEKTIRDLGTCPMDKIGEARKKHPPRCRYEFESFEDFLVHHQLHIMIDGDSRTQRTANADQRELVHPTSEKTQKAALRPEERRRMLQDPDLQKRRRALASRADT